MLSLLLQYEKITKKTDPLTMICRGLLVIIYKKKADGDQIGNRCSDQ